MSAFIWHLVCKCYLGDPPSPARDHRHIGRLYSCTLVSTCTAVPYMETTVRARLGALSCAPMFRFASTLPHISRDGKYVIPAQPARKHVGYQEYQVKVLMQAPEALAMMQKDEWLLAGLAMLVDGASA